jgi:hypothetical protein
MSKQEVLCRTGEVDEADPSLCNYSVSKQISPQTKLTPAVYETRRSYIVCEKKGSLVPGEEYVMEINFTKLSR